MAFEIRRNGRYGRGWESAANPIFEPASGFRETGAEEDAALPSGQFRCRETCAGHGSSRSRNFHPPRQSDTDPVRGARRRANSQGALRARRADMDPGTNCRSCPFSFRQAHRHRQLRIRFLLAANLATVNPWQRVVYSCPAPTSAPLPTQPTLAQFAGAGQIRESLIMNG